MNGRKNLTMLCCKASMIEPAVLSYNTNLTFLSFLYKSRIEMSKKIKLPAVGIELTTDLHRFTSLMPIQLC